MNGIRYNYPNRESTDLTGVELVLCPGDAANAVFRFTGPTAAALEPFNIDQAVEKWINWGNGDDTNYNLWRAIQTVNDALDQEGQDNRVLSYLLRMLPAAPNYQAQNAIDREIGRYLRKLRRYDDAIACYRHGLLTLPKDPKTQYALNNNLAFCLGMTDRWIESENHCRTAISLDPTEYHAQKNLGAALLGQLRFAEAADCFLRTAEVGATEPAALEVVDNFLTRFPQLAVHAPAVVAKTRALIASRTTVPKSTTPATQEGAA